MIRMDILFHSASLISYNNQVVDYGEYTLKYENGDLVEISTTKEYVSLEKRWVSNIMMNPNQIVIRL